ncbi:MAG: MFS transporter [Actinobacteria bacterium]|nr:MAG: MFS transporter [Actinomycetota bacterium]
MAERRVQELRATPFGRLLVAHVVLIAGDTLVTIALAGSLFFSISPHAARGRVALYLALTMAPFAVIAPLLGPLLDRGGARRAMVVVSGLGRAVVCLLMANDLKSLLLFPEAFAVLVLSKGYSIAKSALVPAAVAEDRELVGANSRLALAAIAVGLVASVPGIAVLKLVGARWVLRLAAVVFVGGGLAAFGISSGRATEKTGRGTDPDLRTAGIVLAASAMALLRGSVGFLTFLLAFALRHSHAPSWWFGLVLAASMAGSLIGTASAPRLRRLVPEERILLGALVLVTVVGLFASRAGGRPWAAGMAAAVAIAATAGKLAFDSLVQRDAPDAARGRSFARFETRFQLSWVVGALIPVVVPVPSRLGYLVLAVVALFAAASYVAGRRAVRRAPPAPA